VPPADFSWFPQDLGPPDAAHRPARRGFRRRDRTHRSKPGLRSRTCLDGGWRGGDVLVAMSARDQLTAPAGPDSPSAPETVHALVQVVFRELYRKLFKRNKRLFSPLRNGHNVLKALQSAYSGNWKNIFGPVTTEELRASVRKLVTRGAVLSL
jgi:hypothetical protein